MTTTNQPIQREYNPPTAAERAAALDAGYAYLASRSTPAAIGPRGTTRGGGLATDIERTATAVVRRDWQSLDAVSVVERTTDRVARRLGYMDDDDARDAFTQDRRGWVGYIQSVAWSIASKLPSHAGGGRRDAAGTQPPLSLDAEYERVAGLYNPYLDDDARGTPTAGSGHALGVPADVPNQPPTRGERLRARIDALPAADRGLVDAAIDSLRVTRSGRSKIDTAAIAAAYAVTKSTARRRLVRILNHLPAAPPPPPIDATTRTQYATHPPRLAADHLCAVDCHDAHRVDWYVDTEGVASITQHVRGGGELARLARRREVDAARQAAALDARVAVGVEYAVPGWVNVAAARHAFTTTTTQRDDERAAVLAAVDRDHQYRLHHQPT